MKEYNVAITIFGTYCNQANLPGLSAFLPLAITSDDSGSIAVNDASAVLIQSCPEICGNGFDDAGNEVPDCLDSFCCSAKAPVLTKR